MSTQVRAHFRHLTFRSSLPSWSSTCALWWWRAWRIKRCFLKNEVYFYSTQTKVLNRLKVQILKWKAVRKENNEQTNWSHNSRGTQSVKHNRRWVPMRRGVSTATMKHFYGLQVDPGIRGSHRKGPRECPKRSGWSTSVLWLEYLIYNNSTKPNRFLTRTQKVADICFDNKW